MYILAVHEADGQDVTRQEEVAYSLVTGGGKPGQGYPCILEIDDDCGRSGWVQPNADRGNINDAHVDQKRSRPCSLRGDNG